MFPMVPFHALPGCTRRSETRCRPLMPGFVAAYREILPTLIRQARDAAYFVRRPLPQVPEHIVR